MIKKIHLILIYLYISGIYGQRMTSLESYYLPHGNDVFEIPEARGIEHLNKRLYIVQGSPSFLLDKGDPYSHQVYILSKKKTPKITALTFADISNLRGGRKLLLFGSGKNKSNRKLLLKDWQWDSSPRGEILKEQTEYLNINKFYKKVLRTSRGQFKKINITGATTVGSILILANARKDNSWRDNYLILTTIDFFRSEQFLMPSFADIRIRKIIPGDRSSGILSIRGLTYIPQNKTLIYVAVQKESNEKEKSYIGWIKNFDSQLNSLELKPDNVFSVESLNPRLLDKRVQDIAFISANGNLITLALLSKQSVETVILDIK